MKEVMYEIKSNIGTLRGIKHVPQVFDEVVIMYHGFTGNSIEPNYLFTYYAREIAKLGIMVVRMDYLGCGNSDGYFMDQTFTKFLDQAKTIFNTIKHEYSDKKISILGLSMGGAICTELTKTNLEINKVILLSPAINMNRETKEWFENARIIDGKIDVGGMLMDPAFLEDLETYQFQQKQSYSHPVLCIAAKKDESVPYHYVLEYKDVYPNIIFKTIDDADHTYMNYNHRKKVESLILEFLN